MSLLLSLLTLLLVVLLCLADMAAAHDEIVFSLEQEEEPKSALDEEREKHKTRLVAGRAEGVTSSQLAPAPAV